MRGKIISIVLILSMLVSIFSIYSFASEADNLSEDSTQYVSRHIHYKNSFGDDADDFGKSISLANATNSSYEIKTDKNSNKYGSFYFNDNTAVNPSGTNNNVYFQMDASNDFSPGPDKLGYLILEMEINDFGNLLKTSSFIEAHSGSGTLGQTRFAASQILNIGNDGSRNYIYFNNNTSSSNRVTIPSNEWVKIRIEFSVLDVNATTYNIKCHVNGKTFENNYKLGSPASIAFVRLGCTNGSNIRFGIDNIALYSAPENIPSYDDIGSIAKALIMKVGAENAKLDNKQIELEYTPLLIDSAVYCPLYILEEYTGTSCSSKYITSIDGVDYIHLDDIYYAFGKSVKLCDMGLILIGDNEDISSYDAASYASITELMKTFVFNIPSSSEFKSDVKEYTNNFTHPYLLVNADRFAELRDIYKAGNSGSLTNEEDLQLYSYIDKYVNSAISQLKTYCNTTPTGSYTGLLAERIPINTNYTKYNNNGHDNGGRLSVPVGPLYHFAFAYQMTGHLNFARAAYDYSLALGEWNHWGASHFLNCADIAAPFSISYDWLYNAYKELESKGEISKFDGEIYDTKKLAKIIFTHAIVPGYIQSNGINCPWPGSVESRYATTTNNWNAVCTSGMVAAALAILGEEIETDGITFVTQKKTTFEEVIVSISEIGNKGIHDGLETYADYAAKLATMNMNTLKQFGLIEYAPDGSYVESPGYWSYGTNTYFRMVACLTSATGDDYGFMDSWGMDTTCYFAIHSESSDYKEWNFNDGAVGSQDSSYFFFVGNFYGDDNLVRVRKKHLSTGKGYTLFDILYYDQTVTGEPDLSTEYHMIGIDGFSVRSSWDKGAIYAGLIGGPNQVSHGHMDAGSFIYHNNGKIWFHDLGSDNYNIHYTNSQGNSKGYFSNYELYRIGAEGHNIVMIADEQDTLPYGQATSANPKIVKTCIDGDNGGYAILDLSKSYGTHVSSAKRGMLFTDSRSTVIIQDEITFNGQKTAYWFGHYNIASGYIDNVILSADGRTAFMISGNDIMRVSIVSDNSNLKFEIMDCYTYLLDITHRTDKATMGGANTETSRDSFGKLAIKCENVEKLNLAVVIEEVSGYTLGTKYQWTNMDDWSVEAEETPEIDYNFKADYNDYGLHIGSYTFISPDGLYDLLRNNNSSNGYIEIVSTSKSRLTKDVELKLQFKQRNDVKLPLNKYFVIDFDIFSESKFPSGASLGIYTNKEEDSGYIPLLSFDNRVIKSSDKSVSLGTDWMHVSILIDIENDTTFVYIDGRFITLLSDLSLSGFDRVSSVAFKIASGNNTDMASSLLIDNATVRSFGTLYNGSSLSNILSSRTDLCLWSDYAASDILAPAIGYANGTTLYTASDIETAIARGYDITLLKDCNSLINVSNAVTVHTNGYKFDFISNTHIANINNLDVSFTKGTIKVTWHIGNGTVRETYSSSKIATYKYTDSKIGVITEETVKYDNGYLGFRYYTTGWSNTEGGTYLTDEEMIVTSDNCEFWLVNNKPLECLFVTENSSGKFTAYNTESELRTELKSNTGVKKVVLCGDVELLSTDNPGTSLTAGGKNLYLNGFTLSHKQEDKHAFFFPSGATADFNIYGPGKLEAVSSRTLFTSASPTNTAGSNYGVVIKGADIVFDTQLADFRCGQHRFIDCRIEHNTSTSKSILALWNKNPNFLSNGTPQNLLTVTFESSSIYSNTKGHLFSYTSTNYSEIHLVDASIVSNASLIDLGGANVMLHARGNSSIVAKSLTSGSIAPLHVTFDNGVTTNLELGAEYIPANSILTDNYDQVLIYKIASDYATVRWLDLNGNLIVKEKIAVGSELRVYNSKVRQYLSSINDGNAKYRYDLGTVAGIGAIDLKPVNTEQDILQGMNLGNNFALQIYIPKESYETGIKRVVIDDIVITAASLVPTTVNGSEYYLYSIKGIDTLNTFVEHKIVITYSDLTTETYSMSVIDYLEDLLLITSNSDEITLVVKLFKYICSVYAYNNMENSKEYAKITNMIKVYGSYDVLFGNLPSAYSSTQKMSHVFSAACLRLSSSVQLRLTLKPGFTGMITSEYCGKTKTYTIVNGTHIGVAYIEIELDASELNESVTLSEGDNSITYNVSCYNTALNTNDYKLHNVISCLSEYSSAAKKYIGK